MSRLGLVSTIRPVWSDRAGGGDFLPFCRYANTCEHTAIRWAKIEAVWMMKNSTDTYTFATKLPSWERAAKPSQAEQESTWKMITAFAEANLFWDKVP